MPSPIVIKLGSSIVAEDSGDLRADVVERICDEIRPGDAVMVKGSKGTRMTPIVQALKDRFGQAAGYQALKG